MQTVGFGNRVKQSPNQLSVTRYIHTERQIDSDNLLRIWIPHKIWIRSFGPEVLTPIENLDISASCHTLFYSLPHLSALMPPARPPGRCRCGSGIDRTLPSRAPPAPPVSAPPPPARAAARAAPPGRVTARAPPPARASPPPMCEAIRRRADGARSQPARLPLSLHLYLSLSLSLPLHLFLWQRIRMFLLGFSPTQCCAARYVNASYISNFRLYIIANNHDNRVYVD
jgi:hypothetical protein